MARIRATLLLGLIAFAASLAAVACSGTPPPPEGGGGDGTSPPTSAGNPEGGTDEAGSSDFQWMADGAEDFLILLGADRPPSRSLSTIRDVHDLNDWSYRMDVADAVDRCRDAVKDLADSDYESWDDTALVVAILSTMVSRDPASLVRDDCVTTLSWFNGWVHPDAAAMGPGVRAEESEVLRALTVLDELAKKEDPEPNASDRLVCIDAISVLGSYPWDDLESNKPIVVRSSLSRPRGVIRRLTAKDLGAFRANQEVRDTLDRALLRLSDQVVYMSLIAALADASPHVRRTAAANLRSSGRVLAVGSLAVALEKEEEALVQRALADAITDLSTLEAPPLSSGLPALAKALADPDESVRNAAARGMARITGADPGPDQGLAPLVASPRRRTLKKVLSIGLRLLGVALAAFILWRIQYRDLLVREGAEPVVGTVVTEEGAQGEERAWFEPRDGTPKLELPAEWRQGAKDGMEVKLGLFTIVGESDKLLLAIFAFIYGPITLISITRWWYLLRRVGIPIPYAKAFRLTFVGFFFNSAVPGLTGGDLVKAFYIARQAKGARVRAVMSVLMDRAIGLFALGVLSALILVPNLGNPVFRSASSIVFFFLAVCTVFGAVFLSQRLRNLVRLESLIKKLPFSGFFAEVDQGIVIYRKVPGAVVIAVLFSLLNHFTLVMMAIGLGRAIGIDIPFSQFFVFVPVCMMMASIPLLPGGWGVREAAFAYFFGQVGVPVTEAVALSILIGLTQLLWSLLGGIFFLLQPDRASSKDLADFSSEVEAEVEESPAAGS